MFCCMLLGGIINVMQQIPEHSVTTGLFESFICHHENLQFVLLASSSCVCLQLLCITACKIQVFQASLL